MPRTSPAGTPEADPVAVSRGVFLDRRVLVGEDCLRDVDWCSQ